MKALFAILAAHTDAASRIYPLRLPQGRELPAITYQEISSQGTHAMGADHSLKAVRVQVTAWADTYADAVSLAAQVRACLNRYNGAQEDAQVLDVFLDNELALFDPESEASRIVQDYRLFLSAI